MKLIAATFILLLAAGCATKRVDWDSRMGYFSYDDVVLEMGPPENIAQLSDGSRVGDWLTFRGRGGRGGTVFLGHGYAYQMNDFEDPDYYMRLTFNPEGRLTAAKQVRK